MATEKRPEAQFHRSVGMFGPESGQDGQSAENAARTSRNRGEPGPGKRERSSPEEARRPGMLANAPNPGVIGCPFRTVDYLADRFSLGLLGFELEWYVRLMIAVNEALKALRIARGLAMLELSARIREKTARHIGSNRMCLL